MAIARMSLYCLLGWNHLPTMEKITSRRDFVLLPVSNKSVMVSLQDPDQDLIHRCQAGDQPAFNQVVLKYRNRVMGIATRMLGDRVEAEDLAQDVFVKVYRALQGFQGEALFSTWLYRITANSCLNQIRKRKHENQVSGGVDDSEPNISDGKSNPHSTVI